MEVERDLRKAQGTPEPEELKYSREIEAAFTYHPPKGDQTERYELIRHAAKNFAQLIRECTPGCPDQTAAIRKVREAVMTANAAIAINE